jgi:hypothetical protein
LSVPAVTAPTAPVADVTGTVHVTPASDDTRKNAFTVPLAPAKS